MTLDTAMEFSIWKEEPLSPVFSGLEDQTDVWELFKEDVVKQASTPERDPLDDLGNDGGWLPDSPGDSCDSLVDNSPQARITRAQLASQILQDLDEVLIKEEYASDWKTDLSMFDELPSPTPAFFKEEALAGAAPRHFAGLSLPPSHFALPPALAVHVPAFVTPAPPAAVLVPLAAVQQQQPAAESLQQLQHPTAAVLTLPPQQQQHHHHQQQQQQHHHQLLGSVTYTESLLQEFESIYENVEQSHGGALTPPQSPPHHTQHHYADAATAFTYQQQQQQQRTCLPTPPLQLLLPAQGAFEGVLLTPDLHHHHHHEQQQQQQQQPQELIAQVDELVLSRVQAEEAWPAASFTASFAPPSPCTSSSSSCSDSSDSPAPASPETDDPEWLPAASPAASSSGAASPAASASSSSSSAADADAAPSKAARKRGHSKRSKPYGSNVEDKRMRKKEQNKNAATRYRMKKKAEVEVILGEENELKDKNDELQAKVGDLAQEIRYLKNLMRDVFRARGLIK